MNSIRRTKWVASGFALLLMLAPVSGALADDLDSMDGEQFNDASVFASENSLSGSGSQASLVGGAANTGSGTQGNASNDSSQWSDIMSANAGTGTQIDGSSNSNAGDRDSADVIIKLGGYAAITNSDLGASVSGNSVSVSAGSAETSLSLAGENSGFSGLYGVNAVAASAGSQASQNVSVNVGAEVIAY